MHGLDADDAAGQMIVQLRSFSDGLDAVRQTIADGAQHLAEQPDDSHTAEQIDALTGQLQGLRAGLEAIGGTLSSGLEQMSQSKPAAATDQVNALAEHLQGLRAGLEAIGSTLSTGLEQLAEHEPAPVSITSDAAAGFTPETIKELAQELRALAPTSSPAAGFDANSPAQTVNVMHQVPRNVLNVLRNQFTLMQDWLKPIHEATKSQRKDIQQLRATLEETLQTYSVLLAALEAASVHNDQDEEEAAEE